MKKTKNGIKTSLIRLEDLDKALRAVEDLFDRAHACPFLLLGETARTVLKDDQAMGDKIEVGVRRQHLTKEVMSVLKELVKDLQASPNKLEFKIENVPVEVKIIKRDYGFFKMPDNLVYKWADYRIPNPFDSYWKVRGFVR